MKNIQFLMSLLFVNDVAVHFCYNSVVIVQPPRTVYTFSNQGRRHQYPKDPYRLERDCLFSSRVHVNIIENCVNCCQRIYSLIFTWTRGTLIFRIRREVAYIQRGTIVGTQ